MTNLIDESASFKPVTYLGVCKMLIPLTLKPGGLEAIIGLKETFFATKRLFILKTRTFFYHYEGRTGKRYENSKYFEFLHSFSLYLIPSVIEASTELVAFPHYDGAAGNPCIVGNPTLEMSHDPQGQYQIPPAKMVKAKPE